MLVVFGSINMDFHFTVSALPQVGETVLAPQYDTAPGGKGANQALAAARAGAKTAMIGMVGDDGMGQRILNHLRRNEVMTSGIARSDTLPTGMASVIVDGTGKKMVIVASGANTAIKGDQAPDEILHAKNVVLMQMEIPLPESLDVMMRAKKNGAKVILNLAPAIKIPPEALKLVDTLIVNQIEARQLAQGIGIDISKGMQQLALSLSRLGPLNCIVTLGGEGIVAATKTGQIWAAPSMTLEKVVDTAGAGDCFCGTFAAEIHNGKSFTDAIHRATVASGLSCMKAGVQPSYPYLGDIEENMGRAEYPKQIA